MSELFEVPRYTNTIEKPPVQKVKFFFSAHGQLEDYEGIRPALDQADVFVVEAHGWNSATLNHLQDIANGTKIPTHITENRLPKNIPEYEEGLLYRSGKQIEIVDIPEGHQLDEEDDGNAEFSESAQDFIARGDFNTTIGALESAARKNAEYLRKKDQYIEGRLKDLLREIALKKPSVRVLVQMGASHTGISHNLRNDGEAERVNNEVRFDFKDQLVRSYRFGKMPEQGLFVKALVEEVLSINFSDEFSNIPYKNRVEFFRRQLGDITEDQVQRLGRSMESRYFNRVMMNGEDDTLTLSKRIVVESWKEVFGVAIDEIITGLADQK